jgi:hypothetical protein
VLAGESRKPESFEKKEKKKKKRRKEKIKKKEEKQNQALRRRMRFDFLQACLLYADSYPVIRKKNTAGPEKIEHFFASRYGPAGEEERLFGQISRYALHTFSN